MEHSPSLFFRPVVLNFQHHVTSGLPYFLQFEVGQAPDPSLRFAFSSLALTFEVQFGTTRVVFKEGNASTWTLTVSNDTGAYMHLFCINYGHVSSMCFPTYDGNMSACRQSQPRDKLHVRA